MVHADDNPSETETCPTGRMEQEWGRHRSLLTEGAGGPQGPDQNQASAPAQPKPCLCVMESNAKGITKCAYIDS
jgi:hypothetical protein